MTDDTPRVANEMFYLDKDGNKQDDSLHYAIINPVDFAIDEKIMAPIRAKNRAAHIAKQNVKAKAARWERAKAFARAAIENGQNGLYKDWHEEDHPRAPAGESDGGQFTGSGGGSGGGGSQGSGGAHSGGAGAGAGHHGQQPRTYSRQSAGDAERGRNVVAVYAPTPAAAGAMQAKGQTPITYHELSAKGADQFHAAISAAKSGPYGAAVHVYDASEYAGMRLFLTANGQDGFALKGDDIVSLFKHPTDQTKGIAASSLALATEEGGRRLDCFDTVLPDLYSRNGFTAVARLAWNQDYAPEGWDKSTYKDFNHGEPDVVFMVHDPANAKPYQKGDGAPVSEYDAGSAAQQAALPQALAGYAPGIKADADFDAAKAAKQSFIDNSPVKTIEDAERAGKAGQNVLRDVGGQIAEKLGLTFKSPGPKIPDPGSPKYQKAVDRVLTKAKERGGNIAAVTDLARATFLVDRPEQTDQIIAELGKHFEVAAEPFKVTPELYGDRSANVRLPNGVIAEIQMLHPAMSDAKSPDGGGGHDLYAISREAAPTGSKPDPAKYADAVAKQRELYGKTLDGMPKEWRAAFSKALAAAKKFYEALKAAFGSGGRSGKFRR